ncbi:MerR family transcriptional regulator [Roseobacter sp. CCS2]|uniref:MerR family transcriptional regulator n=1 Tax=Roseobacter sp. CCS2 TaxID=391593 RepID=UPI0000F3E5DE|nr:MerR family transcriptional regulator [Roseobacter sp. CCS2]EBA11106.1 transcriptional regulator, MerR family protein [Roseobacter sp. CCS2]
MAKAKDAFRTISEVAEWLDTPTHVLRFWESKFSQIKPVKGAGGRRYYRPTDMDLLGGIKKLLHEDGLTIKGTQKLLREQGVKHVAGLGQSMTAPAPKAKPAVAAVKPTPKPPTPAPQQDAFPFDMPAPAAAPSALTIDLPKPPKGLPAAAPRLIGRAPADPSILQARAAQIAPLLARLDAVRERMRG